MKQKDGDRFWLTSALDNLPGSTRNVDQAHIPRAYARVVASHQDKSALETKCRKGNHMNAAKGVPLATEDSPEWYRPARGAGGNAAAAPPFETRNTHGLVAGHRSPRIYGKVSTALAADLMKTMPDLATFPEAIASWADAEARAALLRAHLDTQGTIDPVSGEIRQSLLSALDRFERRAAAARSQLGLDPRSEAELALLRAKAINEGALAPKVTLEALEALAAQGRTALEASHDLAQGAADPAQEWFGHPAPHSSAHPAERLQVADNASNGLWRERGPE